MGKVVLNTFLFVLIFCLGIGYDISTHGSLESSKTGRYLKNAGLLIYVKPYYNIIEEQSLRLYRWGRKNFPYKEYDIFRNKTIEVTNNIGNGILYYSTEAVEGYKTLRSFIYNWFVTNVPPDFQEKLLKFLTDSYEFLLTYSKKIVDVIWQFGLNTRQWLIENVTREKFTWENLERLFFEFAQNVKVYYLNAASWVGRKVQCLLSA